MTHDKMLDGITRWDFFAEIGVNEPVKYMRLEAVEGDFVKFSDLPALIALVREDEREQARQRVLDAAEHNVKIKGITVAVIQRSVAAQAAEGAA